MTRPPWHIVNEARFKLWWHWRAKRRRRKEAIRSAKRLNRITRDSYVTWTEEGRR